MSQQGQLAQLMLIQLLHSYLETSVAHGSRSYWRVRASVVSARRERIGDGSMGRPDGVTIDFSRPFKRTHNAFVGELNGTFLSGCLDTQWFMDLKEARQLRFQQFVFPPELQFFVDVISIRTQ